MKWPWTRKRGDFTTDVLAAVFTAATTKVSDAGRHAAVEAAAGMLSRTLSMAKPDGPGWVLDYIRPCFLAQVGRDLIRHGQSLHTIEDDRFSPCASWDWRGTNPDPRTWKARVTDYGPTGSRTRIMSFDSLIWLYWGRHLATPSYGSGPLQFASSTGKLAGSIEAALADEAGGPRGQLITQPEGASGDEALEPLREAISKLKGGVAFVESVRGVDNNIGAVPARDFDPKRLGAETPPAIVEIGRDAYRRALAAMGTPAALFDDADGTSQREAMRRYFFTVVKPIAKQVESVISDRLGVPVTLGFDNYYMDIVSRATSFQKFVAGGMPVEKAAMHSGVLIADEPDST